MRTNIVTTLCCGALVALLPLAVGAKTPAGLIHCGVELDREVLPVDGPQRAVIKITLDAPEAPPRSDRPPVNLTIVLDRSGSMSGSKLEKAKEAAIEALRRLDARDIFSLVVYDHQVETVVPAQSAKNVEWIEGRIRSIRSGGNTALFAGISQGAAEIRKHLEGQHVHRVVLLSDGLANTGPASPSDLARLGKALLKERISVSTVGVGTDYNEDLMTQLAQASDGNTYFVESSVDLPRIFAAELGDVLSVVARDVHVEIDFPNGTRPLRIIGRDGRVGPDRVELSFNQLYGRQQKYALVEVEVPAGTANDEREIVVARCSYQNALTQEDETASVSGRARFSNDEQAVRQSANRQVQIDIIDHNAAIARDQAVDFWNEGKRQEAVRVLKVNAAANMDIADRYSLPPEAVVDNSQNLDLEADDLEQKGLDSRQKKAYRASSYKTRSQQQIE